MRRKKRDQKKAAEARAAAEAELLAGTQMTVDEIQPDETYRDLRATPATLFAAILPR